MSNPSIDCDYLLQTLRDLVQIDSVNPSLVKGAAGEREIAGYVAASLNRCGLKTEVFEPEAGRITVVGRLKGKSPGRSLMLNAHYDTVGVDGMEEPFSGRLSEGRLYGRGSYDMKGSLAACMTAAKALSDASCPFSGELFVAAVADEEYASLGTADLLLHLNVEGAVVTEPTDLNICIAHKGFIWLEIETLGRAAHGSRFDLGIDANLRMGRFLARLERLERELRKRQAHPLVGPPSLHAATIQGGTELSAYSARCRLQLERRTVPGESQLEVVQEVRTILDELASEDESFRAQLKVLFAREPFEVAETSRIVQAVKTAATQILPAAPALVGETPWMDSALLAAAGVDTVVIGPSGGGAHSHQEWVDLHSVEELARILTTATILYTR